MAGIEDLSPSELQQYKLGKLLLESDPEVRRSTLRLAKKANPKLNLPEVELEDRLDAERDETIKREQKLEADLIKERVERRRSEQRRRIEAAGYTEDEIEKIIVDYGIHGGKDADENYDRAMKIASMIHSSAEPTAGDVRSGGNAKGMPVEMRPDKEWRALPNAGLRLKSATEAGKMIDEFQSQRRSASR